MSFTHPEELALAGANAAGGIAIIIELAKL